MKRVLLLFLLIAVCNGAVYASEPARGYRGFVEWNTEFGWRDAVRYGEYPYWEEYTAYYFIYGISTSHGYQFNPHLFVGGGVWVQVGAGDIMRRLELPLFAHVRTDWTFGKVPLYGEIRIGGTISGREFYNGQDKILIAPAVGYRLDWGRRVCANFAVGVTLHGIDDRGWSTHFTFKPLPSVKIGIEF